MKRFFGLSMRLPGGGAVCECSASERAVFPSGFDPEGRFEWPSLVSGSGRGFSDRTGKNQGDEYDSTLGRHCDHLLNPLRSPECLTLKAGGVQHVCPIAIPAAPSNMPQSYSMSGHVATGHLLGGEVDRQSRRGR